MVELSAQAMLGLFDPIEMRCGSYDETIVHDGRRSIATVIKAVLANELWFVVNRKRRRCTVMIKGKKMMLIGYQR